LSISEDSAIETFHQNSTAQHVLFAIYRQSPVNVDEIVDSLVEVINDYASGKRPLGLRSDMLFYAASHYMFWTFRKTRESEKLHNVNALLRSYADIRKLAYVSEDGACEDTVLGFDKAPW